MTRPRRRGAGIAGASARRRGAPLILIVDDLEDNRAIYVHFLRFQGYRVAEGANGREALDKAVRLRPDLIVMDLSLPVMDGWEATRRLKRDNRTRRIPVLALTGHAMTGQAKIAKDAGCDGYITKPCLPEDLETQIRRFLGAGRGAVSPKSGGRTPW